MENIKELKEKMKNVPFGNSQFQIINFISNQATPERTYRNVLLQLNQKLNTMQESYFRRKRKQIDIEETKNKMQSAEGFELSRFEIDLEETEYQLENEIKLIEDCIIEIKTYEKILEQLPDVSRDEFETSERLYWEKRLIQNALAEVKAAGRVEKGTLQALNQINIDIRDNKGQLVFDGQIENKAKVGLVDIKSKESH